MAAAVVSQRKVAEVEMAMVEGIYAGWIGISQEWLSLLVACVYDMILTDGSTDRLVDGLVDERVSNSRWIV